ncbi:MAG: fimbria/pilus periplasmic chaperone [Pseudomonadota bacterium]
MKSRVLGDWKIALAALAFAAMALAAMPMGSAQAQLSVSEMIVDMSAPDNRRDLTVTNNGDETMYVAVEIKEFINPGMPDQTEIEHRSPEDTGLLVSPSKMVLGAGERAVVRMAVIERPDAGDRVFQVTVKPVLGEEDTQTTMIRMLIAYGVLVIVRPEELMPEFNVQRSGQMLLIENSGNTMVEFAYGQQCDTAGNGCVELPSKRVYPGGTWQVDLAYDTPAEYRVTSGGETEVRTY